MANSALANSAIRESHRIYAGEPSSISYTFRASVAAVQIRPRSSSNVGLELRLVAGHEVFEPACAQAPPVDAGRQPPLVSIERAKREGSAICGESVAS